MNDRKVDLIGSMGDGAAHSVPKSIPIEYLGRFHLLRSDIG